MKTALLVGALLLTSTGVTAQQRPERDPNSMGGGNCAANVYNCRDTPNPASRREHGLDRGDDVDGRPRRPGGR